MHKNIEKKEVYEQNGPGWVFSNFVSLQLTLWHLDPLRRAVVNIRGTGDDCFKWVVLVDMYPVDIHEDRWNK